MKILYVSCYPKSYFDALQGEAINALSQPSQKFNYLFARGLCLNKHDVVVLNPIDQLTIKREKKVDELINYKEDDIDYFFLPTNKDNPTNKRTIEKNIKSFMTEWVKNNSNSIIVLDVLKPYVEYVVKYSFSIPVVSIVTDLPEHLYFSSDIKSYIRRQAKILRFKYIIKNSSAFVFLTEQMNKRLNKSNKPYELIEGLVDSEQENDIGVRKKEGYICAYTGALHARYGIEKLVKAFQLPEMMEYELHLYGNGDYVDEIRKASDNFSNIKYFGAVDNRTAVERQKMSNVLLNPRPINEEFTLYSYPSKNMEYMLSGVPLLTSDLPGMPNDYKKYVYIMDVSTPESISKSITSFFAISIEERLQNGKRAYDFISLKKNNVIQSARIVQMARRSFKV